MDHDLGGSSKKNGTIITDAAAAPFPTQHKRRSSTSNVHRGITHAQFDLFVRIVAQQAMSKARNRHRGNIIDKASWHRALRRHDRPRWPSHQG